ncbi:hypothetical protein BXU09_20000 [Deinococcus sp. LM3]|nr:hypothetical protein BXU09_20000 [Deinococcus sp. LM3]
MFGGRGRDLLDVRHCVVSGRATLNGMSDGHARANLDLIRVLLEELAMARDEAPAAGAEPEPERRAVTALPETAEADVREEP